MPRPLLQRPPRFTEPWTTTAVRTVGLALAVGLAVAIASGHIGLVPRVAAVALWFTLGGHFLELYFRNALAARIPGGSAALRLARLLYWFAAGCLLYAGANATWHWAGQRPLRFSWWVGGVGFVAAELVVHAAMQLRRLPNFYDGRG